MKNSYSELWMKYDESMKWATSTQGLFSQGGGSGHTVQSPTLTKHNFKRLDEWSANLLTFPKIWQRKFSCVNDMPTMVDVSIATVNSVGHFNYWDSYWEAIFVQTFPPLRFQEESNPLLFIYFFHVVVVNYLTAASKLKVVLFSNKKAHWAF